MLRSGNDKFATFRQMTVLVLPPTVESPDATPAKINHLKSFLLRSP